MGWDEGLAGRGGRAGLGPGLVEAQAPQPLPQFGVASVRPNNADTTDSGMDYRTPGRFVATHVPLSFLILEAYEIMRHQLIGAPEWTWDKAYDVTGLYPAADGLNLHEVHRMERQVLVERFGLKVHPEQRELAAYDLVVASRDGHHLGPQMHKASMDCEAWVAAGRPKVEGLSKSLVRPMGKRPTCMMMTARTWLSGGARTMGDLAGSLEAMLDRPVVDRTGLAGVFDMDLQWARTDLQADETSQPLGDGPSIFTAVMEQLGLKLVPHKELLPVLVVDEVHAPTPN